MWTWLFMADLVVLMVLAGCAGYVALFVRDERRASRAYRVFKITIGALTGGNGIAALAMRLYELELLDVPVAQVLREALVVLG